MKIITLPVFLNAYFKKTHLLRFILLNIITLMVSVTSWAQFPIVPTVPNPFVADSSFLSNEDVTIVATATGTTNLGGTTVYVVTDKGLNIYGIASPFPNTGTINLGMYAPNQYLVYLLSFDGTSPQLTIGNNLNVIETTLCNAIVGPVQVAVTAPMIDTDGDGIDDIADIDDDNDGILDIVESGCGDAGTVNFGTPTFRFDPNQPGGAGAGLNGNTLSTTPVAKDFRYQPDFVDHNAIETNVTAPVFGAGLTDESLDTVNNDVAIQGYYYFSGVDQTTAAGALTDEDYVEFTFTTLSTATVIARFIQVQDVITFLPNGNFNTSRGTNLSTDTRFPIYSDFTYQVEISTDNFTTSTVLVSNMQTTRLADGSPFSGGFGNALQEPTHEEFINFSGLNYQLTASTTYKVRMYLYAAEGTGADAGFVTFDNFRFLSSGCASFDLDVDGIPNQLDLDSDGDGCADAVEGDAGFTEADISNSGILGGNTGGSFTGDPTIGGVVTNLTGNFNGSADPEGDGFVNASGQVLTLEDGTAVTPSPANQALNISQDATMQNCDDDDNVDVAIEDAAPNGGDGNNDGTIDSLQPDVASIPDRSGTGSYVTLEVTGDCSQITNMEIIQESEIVSNGGIEDEDYEYPFGLVDFTLECDVAGQSATIKFYWYGIDALEQRDDYRKYGDKVFGVVDKVYRNFIITEAIENVNGAQVYTVEYQLTDGRLGDDSLNTAEILDPTGPAVSDNTDNDLLPDLVDIDDDNDGIPDSLECTSYTGNPVFSGVGNTITGILNNTDGDEVFNIAYSDAGGAATSGAGGITTTPGDLPSSLVFNQNTLFSVQAETANLTFSGLPIGTYDLSAQVDTTTFTADGGTTISPDGLTITVTTTESNVTVANFVDPQVLDNLTITTTSADTTNNFDINISLSGLACPDTDNDGIPDNLDIDSDNDGIPDNVEAQSTAGYQPPLNNDSDMDGLDDQYDPEFGGSTPITTPENSDTDTIPDYLDTDSDDDGIPDTAEADLGIPTNTNDTDMDGLLDAFDVDNSTADVNNNLDNGSSDTPNTDVGDPSQTDTDVDYRDLLEPLDTDGDGIPDVTDLDDDNDGITDVEENTCEPNATPAPSPLMLLYDNAGGDFSPTTVGGDFVVSASSQMFGSGVSYTEDPNNVGGGYIDLQGVDQANLAGAIADNDYLEIDFTTGSNPYSISQLFFFAEPMGIPAVDFRSGYQYQVAISGDNFVSNVVLFDEATVGTSSFRVPATTNLQLLPNTFYKIRIYLYNNPAVNAGSITIDNIAFRSLLCTESDFDGDGILNSADLDSDNDGIYDVVESGNPLATDTDNDGRIDTGGTVEVGANGIPNEVDSDDDAFSATGTTPVNSFGSDGPDYLDIDADDDGIVDNIEAQTTADYIAPSGIDTDGDGIDNVYDPVDDTDIAAPVAVAGVTAITPTNTDTTFTNSDAIPDYLDTDSDGDGESDTIEAYDTDQDGVADTVPANADADGDGLDDNFDGIALGTGTSVTNPTNGGQMADDPFPDADMPGMEPDWREGFDTDGDGVPDSADLDDDNDGILDTEEDPDIDGDGNPNTGAPADIDPDGDGIPNHLDIDSDNDGIPDNVEAQPTVGYIAPTGSVGNNGLFDVYETGADDDTETGISPENTDATFLNNDTIPDYLDTDSDGDGKLDGEEAGLSRPPAGTEGINGLYGDYEIADDYGDTNGTVLDPSNDPINLPNTDPNATPEVDFREIMDSDGDGIADVVDLDDDNDGIPDTEEGSCDLLSIANSNSGSGAFQDELYIFNWDGADLSNGIQDGDTQTFTLANGLSVTATFSNVSNVTNASSYVPTDLNSFAGAFIHQLYNTPGTQEALLGAMDAHVSFRVTFTATKAGLAFPLNIIAFDGEATLDPEERITFTTDGGNWTLLESINSGGNWIGGGTKVLDAVDTEISGGSSIFYSENSSTIDIDILSINGRQAVAFGLYLVCDEDGDGLPNLIDLDSD
uniref:hypothetical protein n=1 Tax=Aquimarina agarivorans TaxID=980584 RepID=UPI000248F877